MYLKVGSAIKIEESKTSETYTKIINGYSFENSLDSEDFVQKNITLPIIFLKDFENQNLENLFEPNINNYFYIKNFVNSDNFKILVEKRFKNQINYLETFL